LQSRLALPDILYQRPRLLISYLQNFVSNCPSPEADVYVHAVGRLQPAAIESGWSRRGHPDPQISSVRSRDFRSIMQMNSTQYRVVIRPGIAALLRARCARAADGLAAAGAEVGHCGPLIDHPGGAWRGYPQN
jgi:hypothetical protein